MMQSRWCGASAGIRILSPMLPSLLRPRPAACCWSLLVITIACSAVVLVQAQPSSEHSKDFNRMGRRAQFADPRALEGPEHLNASGVHVGSGATSRHLTSQGRNYATYQGTGNMEEVLQALEDDRIEIESAHRDAALRWQQPLDQFKEPGLPGSLLENIRPSSWAWHSDPDRHAFAQSSGRHLLDTNSDADGWPVDSTLHPELQRPFDGDYIGDGETWGDQFTGGLMDMSVGGDVYGWGLNNYGQLGTGDVLSFDVPSLVPVLRNKNSTIISAGAEHSAVISKEGFVWAWGRNDGGQLGLSDSTLSSCESKGLQSNCNGPRPARVLFPSSLSDLWGEQVVDISSMNDHNLAITRSGWTYSWGRNSHGQLGTGDTTDRNVPTKVKNSYAYRFVIARTGGSHSMGLSARGEVFVWGSGASGQLGQDIAGLGPRSANPRLSLEPIQVEALKDFMVIQITAGWSHCIALTVDGEVWMWGGNRDGQLGLGDLTDRFEPVKLQDSINGNGRQIGACISIAAGRGHSLWLNGSGLVFSAGRNDGGQLGLGDSIDRSHVSYVDIPVRVWCDTPFGSQVGGAYADWVCVNSRVRNECGRRCVGIGVRKDCGPSNITSGLQPSDCESLMPVDNLGIEVHASEYNSYVISRDNNLFAWGSNTYGQVGINPEDWGRLVRKPRLVMSVYGKNITSVSGGREHSVARTDREAFVITDFSPESGPVNGGSAMYIIGQGFNTFVGDIECRFSFYSNGTHTSQYGGTGIVNETIVTLTVKAERYSSMRLKCITPDVRFRDPDGDIDMARMASSLRTLETPRNVTIWWKGKYQLTRPREFVWYYIALPGITGIIPKAGPVTGGTYLLVTGYGFDPVLSSDVRIRFGLTGNNWMRGCILSETLIVTVTPPSGPSDNGLMDFDGACNNLCPTGFEAGCECTDIQDFSPKCVRGIVRASLDPRNQASRRDRCPECEYVVGDIMVMVSLNGGDYGDIAFPFLYYENPSMSHLSAPVYTVGHIPGSRDHTQLSYGGPEEGGTTVDFHGKGFAAVGLGQAICSWGCSYADTGNSIGPKCDSGSARHSLKMSGQFTKSKEFQFDKPYPPKVWDLIHYGTWFKCAEVHDLEGCRSYNKTSGILRFEPGYDEIYAPTFRGYNETTIVVTSCLEDCESRAEFVSDTLLRCIAPPRVVNSGNGVLTPDGRILNVTVRLKVNGQDIFPDCTGSDCSAHNEAAFHYLYYKQPAVKSITPNGGPLMDEPFVYVYGSGFTTFNWYPLCQFGRQTVVVNQNSTTFPGWLSHTFRTNTSAWVVNDTLLVCYAPPLPPHVPAMVDKEIDVLKKAEIAVVEEERDREQLAFLNMPTESQKLKVEQLEAKLNSMKAEWAIGRQSIHEYVIGKAFPGEDGLLSTYEDNFIYANVSYGKGTIAVPFTVTFNGQDYLDGSHVHWPRNPPPMSRLPSLNQKFVYYPHPILQSSFPLGGPVVGLTKIIVRGIGFHLYNELSSWYGQYDPPTMGFNCVVMVVEMPYAEAEFNDYLDRFKVAVTKVIEQYSELNSLSIQCAT